MRPNPARAGTNRATAVSTQDRQSKRLVNVGDPCLANEVECHFQRRPSTFAPILAGSGKLKATRPKVKS
jgi:hypothetical protein